MHKQLALLGPLNELTLIFMKLPSLFLIVFALKSIVSDVNIATSAFLSLLVLKWYVLFLNFYF